MKNVGLYTVYDTVNQTTIMDPVHLANNLVAALGFYNSFIKDPKKEMVPFKALKLIRLAQFEVDEDGIWKNPTTTKWELNGEDCKSYINSEMAARGVDDFFDAENAGD